MRKKWWEERERTREREGGRESEKKMVGREREREKTREREGGREREVDVAGVNRKGLMQNKFLSSSKRLQRKQTPLHQCHPQAMIVMAISNGVTMCITGNLQSYRGKFQLEYELGSVLNQPEKEPEPEVVAESIDTDAMQLVPADEDDTQTYSLDTSSDLLF